MAEKSERALETEASERAEVEAGAELGVGGRAGPGSFGVLGGVVEVAPMGEEGEAAGAGVFAGSVDADEGWPEGRGAEGGQRAVLKNRCSNSGAISTMTQ